MNKGRSVKPIYHKFALTSLHVKHFLPALFIGLFISACTKESPPITGGTPPPPPVENPYAGDYYGLFYEHVAGVDSNGVYKSDTSYSYTVTVLSAGADKITIHGQTDLESIVVDSSGYFEFNDYNRNIEGHFVNDSLYIFSDAISGTYSPPQWYNNTQLSFNGKKQ